MHMSTVSHDKAWTDSHVWLIVPCFWLKKVIIEVGCRTPKAWIRLHTVSQQPIHSPSLWHRKYLHDHADFLHGMLAKFTDGHRFNANDHHTQYSVKCTPCSVAMHACAVEQAIASINRLSMSGMEQDHARNYTCANETLSSTFIIA